MATRPAPASSPAPDHDGLVTPLLRVDAGDVVTGLNGACAAWLGVGARRLVGQGLAALGGEPVALTALAARARAHDRPVCARRQLLAAPGGERFADAWAVPGEGGALHFEFHPTDEFPGEDPATLLPAALGAALKGLAHEIKNPLAGMKGAAQMLARRVREPELARFVEVIEAEGTRLATLVDRLLEPGGPARAEPLNVHAVLERVRTLAEAEAGWSLKLERDYDPSLPELSGDPDRLTQALLNLVRNALEAGASEVRLRTRAEHGVTIGERAHRMALRIEIEDNGRGVPEDLAERIFLPLVSGRAEGSGLGLPLAQQVAREHGGSLGYRSRPGHTLFSLLLPAPPPQDDETDVEPVDAG